MTRTVGLATGVLCAALLSCPESGAEGFDRTERPHVGAVRDAGSIPAASTHPTPRPTFRVSRDRTPAGARDLAVRIARRYGYHTADLRCLLNLWQRESRFRPQALNRRSGAGGIPQILGLNPNTPTSRQIQRGLAYITHRYGGPCQALHHHNRQGWY